MPGSPLVIEKKVGRQHHPYFWTSFLLCGVEFQHSNWATNHWAILLPFANHLQICWKFSSFSSFSLLCCSLKEFQCYGMKSENLQSLCLRIVISSRELSNTLKLADKCKIALNKLNVIAVLSTVLMSISRVIEDIKRLLGWLDRLFFVCFDLLHPFAFRYFWTLNYKGISL